MSHRAKTSGQMWDGPSSSCLGWALLWMKSKGPRECLARFSPFTWGKWFLQASWELSEMYHGLVWVFRGRWETILLAGFMQLHSCQPLGSRSGGVSHWIAPFFPSLPALYAVVWCPPNAAVGSQPCLECPSWKVWTETLTTAAQVRSNVQMDLGVGMGLPENQLCGLPRLWALRNPWALGRVFLPRSFIVIFIFPPIHLKFELVIDAYGNKNQKGIKGCVMENQCSPPEDNHCWQFLLSFQV